MATIHEQFDMRGVHYTEIHFKVTPLARDLITRFYRDGAEISAEGYQDAKAEYKRLWSAAHGFQGGIMRIRIGTMFYRGAVAAKEFFERAKIGWAVSLAKLAVAAISRVTRAAQEALRNGISIALLVFEDLQAQGAYFTLTLPQSGGFTRKEIQAGVQFPVGEYAGGIALQNSPTENCGADQNG